MEYSVTSQTPIYISHEKGVDQDKKEDRAPLVNLGTAS